MSNLSRRVAVIVIFGVIVLGFSNYAMAQSVFSTSTSTSASSLVEKAKEEYFDIGVKAFDKAKLFINIEPEKAVEGYLECINMMEKFLLVVCEQEEAEEYIQSAKLYMSQAHFEIGLWFFNKAEKSDPKDSKTTLNLLNQIQGQMQEAKNYYDNVISAIEKQIVEWNKSIEDFNKVKEDFNNINLEEVNKAIANKEYNKAKELAALYKNEYEKIKGELQGLVTNRHFKEASKEIMDQVKQNIAKLDKLSVKVSNDIEREKQEDVQGKIVTNIEKTERQNNKPVNLSPNKKPNEKVKDDDMKEYTPVPGGFTFSVIDGKGQGKNIEGSLPKGGSKSFPINILNFGDFEVLVPSGYKVDGEGITYSGIKQFKKEDTIYARYVKTKVRENTHLTITITNKRGEEKFKFKFYLYPR